VILDTSFLLDLKDGNPDAFGQATRLYEEGTLQRIAVPSVMELQYGATFVDSDDERRRIENLLTMYPVVPLRTATARRAGELLARADRAEDGASGVDNEDALIAATAERVGEPVLTRNTDDFRLLGVETESY
jgi:tRNA(fMet)-specific endonuclease VapC